MHHTVNTEQKKIKNSLRQKQSQNTHIHIVRTYSACMFHELKRNFAPAENYDRDGNSIQLCCTYFTSFFLILFRTGSFSFYWTLEIASCFVGARLSFDSILLNFYWHNSERQWWSGYFILNGHKYTYEPSNIHEVYSVQRMRLNGWMDGWLVHWNLINNKIIIKHLHEWNYWKLLSSVNNTRCICYKPQPYSQHFIFDLEMCVFLFLQCNIPISLFVDLIMFMSYNKWMIRVSRIFHSECVSYAIMIAIG